MAESGNRDRQLTDALRAVARSDNHMGSSASVEARLLQEVRSIAWARRQRAYVTIAPLAAALILIVAMLIWRSLGRPAIEPSVARSSTQIDRIATAFLPLIYSNVPAGNVHSVLLDVPESALVSFGLLAIDSMSRAPAPMVQAEVLVGEDGLARAVRFVRPVARQEQRQ
jgi:hypothetical protein